ncbi:MAG: tetratricopeptide repeat protein [Hyphomonadaceae bacterium]
MLLLILSYLPSLLCGIHAVRTGRAQFWLWILVIGGPLGALIYVCAEIVPELLGGRTARRMGQAARHAIDPERELREAKHALEDTPSIANRMRIARAAAALNRWDEAEQHWRACVQGQFADDPAVLYGHAQSLIELGRFDEALKPLETLRGLGKEGETGQVALAFGRAYEGLGRLDDAAAPYRYAADRVPGLEAGARYVAYLAKAGLMEDARIGFSEIERRFAKIAGPLRAEARTWRDLAARAVESK